MFMNFHFLTFFSFFAFLALALTKRSPLDVVPPDYMPPPWLDNTSKCHPNQSSQRNVPLDSAVCDPSGLLSKRELSHLDSVLADIHTGTSPYSLVSCEQSSSDFQYGFRVAVALVRRMSFDRRTLASRAENFANTLFENWRLNTNCGASVLLFLSVEDKRIFIRTGTLTVQYLNEHQIDDVYAKMIPRLSSDRLARGLETGISQIGSYLSKYRGKRGGARNTEQQPNGAAVPLFFRDGPEWWDLELSIVVIIFVVLVVIACCNGVGGPEAARKRRERRHLLKKLDILRSEYISAMLPQYIPSTCPYCQDDLSPPWIPSVPTLATIGDDNQSANNLEEPIESKPVRTLRCGHSFHEACFDYEHPGLGAPISECPVCKDQAGGTTTPRSLSDTRPQDLSFRLQRLCEVYPHILTDDVVAKLQSQSPSTWPDTMTDAYLHRQIRQPDTQVEERADNSWWSGVGGLLAAGGIGALLGSFFGGLGRRRREGPYYTDIPTENGGGHIGRWGVFNDTQLNGGGHGTGWGNALSDAASRFSGGDGWGRSWGFGGGDRVDGTHGSGGHGAGW